MSAFKPTIHGLPIETSEAHFRWDARTMCRTFPRSPELLAVQWASHAAMEKVRLHVRAVLPIPCPRRSQSLEWLSGLPYEDCYQAAAKNPAAAPPRPLRGHDVCAVTARPAKDQCGRAQKKAGFTAFFWQAASTPDRFSEARFDDCLKGKRCEVES